MKSSKKRQVDMQVSIFTAIIVMLSLLCIYSIYYHFTYKDMINSLEDRVFSIHDHLENTMDASTFSEINTIEDEERQSYQDLKLILDNVKAVTGVRYLYTAKKTATGDFVYVVDGLPYEAEDFRHPGDLIEPEIYSAMERALSGETVLPDDIKKTDWGKIFITYFPIYHDETVVGVLGIEFEAGHQYNTYHSLKIITPIIAIVICLIAMKAAAILFKRISNPTYQDYYNTDQLSQLKNRNAYDTDIQNMFAMGRLNKVGVIAMDLNNLKYVNDHMGHYAGDQYIQSAAAALKRALGESGVAYRVGGDEFIMVVRDATTEKLEGYMKNIKSEFEKERFTCEKKLSIAMGCALYEKGMDKDLYDTGKRADDLMYEDKKILHMEDRNQSIS